MFNRRRRQSFSGFMGTPRVAQVFMRQADGSMKPVEMDDEMRAALNSTALEEMGRLIGLLQMEYGLIIHKGREDRGWAYHWHEEDGTCHSDQTHDGFENAPAAIMGGLTELLFVERLNGLAPLVSALAIAGIDLAGMIMSMNDEENDVVKVRTWSEALTNAFRALEERARSQPSGFAGEIVSAFLTTARDLVRIAGKDAHAVQGTVPGLPIPAALPAGYVAVPAMSIVLLEQVLAEIDQNAGGPQNDNRSHIARTA